MHYSTNLSSNLTNNAHQLEMDSSKEMSSTEEMAFFIGLIFKFLLFGLLLVILITLGAVVYIIVTEAELALEMY